MTMRRGVVAAVAGMGLFSGGIWAFSSGVHEQADVNTEIACHAPNYYGHAACRGIIITPAGIRNNNNTKFIEYGLAAIGWVSGIGGLAISFKVIDTENETDPKIPAPDNEPAGTPLEEMVAEPPTEDNILQ
jgi:hypothetical protein